MEPRRARLRSSVLVALAVPLAIALVGAGCGSDTDNGAVASADRSTTTQGVTPAPDGDADGQSALPNLQVVDLASGDTVDLATLSEAGRPTLLWFWAPHCTICRREAPELLELSAEHGAELRIVGVGAQDSLDQAYGFLDDTSTHDLPMIWDRSGRSWRHFGVTSQPTVIVLDAEGKETGRWFREFDPDAILDAAGLA